MFPGCSLGALLPPLVERDGFGGPRLAANLHVPHRLDGQKRVLRLRLGGHIAHHLTTQSQRAGSSADWSS
eukprot:1585337-Pyramimonas_sp.AAC.1